MKWTMIVASLLFPLLVIGQPMMGWDSHELPGNYGLAEPHTGDMDLDGDLDILCAGYLNDGITWWENVGGTIDTWIYHSGELGECGYIDLADLDGDGDLDVLASNSQTESVHWYETSVGDSLTWTVHDIDLLVDGTRQLTHADIDLDGDMDVVGTAGDDNLVLWWENVDGAGLTWTRRTVDDDIPFVEEVRAIDFDDDGDLDILAGAEELPLIAWYETVPGDPVGFIRHVISTERGNVSHLRAADFDNDGDLDVLVGTRYGGVVSWFENVDGLGTLWSEMIIVTLDASGDVEAADVDEDGDMDVLTMNAVTVTHRVSWWENQNGGSVWVEHLIDDELYDPWFVDVADYDLDDDLDVVVMGTANNMELFEQRQFAVEVVMPNGGDIWPIGTDQMITWTTYVDDPVSIELMQGENVIETIASEIDNAGEYTWTVSPVQPNDYRIRIRTEYLGDPYSDLSDEPFTVGVPLQVISPNGGEEWPRGADRRVRWTATTDTPIDIDLYRDSQFIATIASNVPDIGEYTFTIPDGLQDGLYSVLIRTESNNSEYADSSDAPFTLGTDQIVPSGPCRYGYRMYDEYDGPAALAYDWIEIDPTLGGPGTATGVDEDDECLHFALPFEFTYYGNTYENFNIDSNGWIAFGDSTETDGSNTGIPSTDGPSAMVAVYWEDLDPEDPLSGGIYSWYDEADHRLIVEWSHIAQWQPASCYETFQVILYDPAHHPTVTGDGMIQLQYREMSREVGVEGTVGVEYEPYLYTGVEYLRNDDYDVHASPIVNGMSLTVVTADPETVPAPTNLTAQVVGLVNGVVRLEWEYDVPPAVSDRPAPVPQAQRSGEKADRVRDEDRRQYAQWQQSQGNGLEELDEFLGYRIYRIHDVVGESATTFFEDTLPEEGNYWYQVSAVHDIGESRRSDYVNVEWTDPVSFNVFSTDNQVEPGGGSYVYTATLTCDTPQPFEGVDYWTEVLLPDSTLFSPVFRTRVTVPANADLEVQGLVQEVPGYAPAGEYIHISKVGIYPNLVIAEDSFPFYKQGDGPTGTPSLNLADWGCSGWSPVIGTLAVDPVLPKQFSLGEVTPNPFNPTTKVSVALPHAAELKVTVYNLMGRTVAELTDGLLPAGEHRFTLDGSTLASGMYFVRAEAGGEWTAVRKVVLLR